MKESGKPVLYGGYMIACSMLGGVAVLLKAYSVLAILLSAGTIFLVLSIRGLAKNRKA